MKRSSFTKAQIIEVLRQAETEACNVDLCHPNRITETIFLQMALQILWNDSSNDKSLRLLEEERPLKKLEGEQALGIVVLKDVLSINFNAPSQQGSRITFVFDVAT